MATSFDLYPNLDAAFRFIYVESISLACVLTQHIEVFDLCFHLLAM